MNNICRTLCVATLVGFLIATAVSSAEDHGSHMSGEHMHHHSSITNSEESPTTVSESSSLSNEHVHGDDEKTNSTGEMSDMTHNHETAVDDDAKGHDHHQHNHDHHANGQVDREMMMMDQVASVGNSLAKTETRKALESHVLYDNSQDGHGGHDGHDGHGGHDGHEEHDSHEGHGGHDAHMNKNGSTGHGMMMYFHVGVHETVLFKEWVVSNVEGMVGSVIGIIILATLYEGLKYFREDLFKHYVSSLQFSTVAVTGESGRVTQVHKVEKHRMLSWAHGLQTCLHVLQMVISYFLMLIFMTYNVWLCLAVIIGSGLGYFIFGWKKATVVDITEHCH